MKLNVYSVIKSVNDEEAKITFTRGETSDTIIIKTEVPIIVISKEAIRDAIKGFEKFDEFEKGENNVKETSSE